MAARTPVKKLPPGGKPLRAVRTHSVERKIGSDFYTFYIAEKNGRFFQINEGSSFPLSPHFATKAAAIRYAVDSTRSYLEDRALGKA